MTIKKKRLTIEELQRMAKDRFPLVVECDTGGYTGHLKKITILSPVLSSEKMVAVLDADGVFDAFDNGALSHYPSFEPDEPEEVEWFQIISMRKGDVRPESSRYLYKSKEDFLYSTGSKESSYYFIDLIPVKKYPDYSKQG